jgi:deoxycytidylate deaminase
MGTCSRRNVGAILLSNGRVREAGWNGMERARDLPTCAGGACPRGNLTEEQQPRGTGYSNCIYLHAEYNVGENFRHAVRARNVALWAVPMDVVIVSSSVPCEDCMSYATWAGIELVWEGME